MSLKYPCFGRRSLSGPVRNKSTNAKTNAKTAQAPPKRKQAKTAEELDRELDAFMGDADNDEPLQTTAIIDGSDGLAPVRASDVEMV